MELQIKDLPLDQLIAHKNNSRTHSEKQIKKIAKSIKEFGFNDPIAVDSNNNIIAGHARATAALQAGLSSVPTVSLAHLTKTQQRAYIIAHNRLALDAAWDNEMLSIELKELKDADFDLELIGFDDVELDSLLEQETIGFTDPDTIPENVEPICKEGDIWQLGNHRLMCGDATNVSQVENLMNGDKADMVFTDPPYNTGMTSESQKGSGGLWKGTKGSTWLSHMFNDSYTAGEWEIFISSFIHSYWKIMKDNSVSYICLDWRRNHELIFHIEECGFKRSNLIVWDKVVHGLGSDYKYTHEFINVCKKGNPKLDTHQGDREYSDVWHIQRAMGKNENHATAKPIELMERAIRHASNKNYIVADLFGGSGSTLIACEKTNRKCYMMEISPQYCDIIIKRWEDFTGKKANHEKR